MFYVQPYLLCTLFVCMVSLTYHKIEYLLQQFLFHFLFVQTMNVNDNHYLHFNFVHSTVIRHTIQLWEFVYDKYVYAHSLYILFFSQYTLLTSSIHIVYPSHPSYYLILKLSFSMPKYHIYRIPVGLLSKIWPSSPFTRYHSSLTTHCSPLTAHKKAHPPHEW